MNHPLLMSVCVIMLLAGATSALAVMPPDVYIGRQKMAEIQAIATVENCLVRSSGEYSDYMDVTFAVEKLFEPLELSDRHREQWQKVKESGRFQGGCEQVREGAVPPPGGTIYKYPAVGQRVFVSVNLGSGQIEGLTEMTSALDQALKAGLEGIEFNMTGISVKTDRSPAGDEVADPDVTQ